MYTVVVADDEEEIRRALVRRVCWAEAGLEVIGEAENGAEALELVERLEPDLLLTDVRMPFMSGIELAREVREIRPTMQIAFLSGYDDFSYAQQAIQYNIISYMLKPISAAKLTEELIKIRKKLDEKFESFARWNGSLEQSEQLELLMALMLDPFREEENVEGEARLKQQAVACGLPSELSETRYVVMVTRIQDDTGANRTVPGSVTALDSIIKKYLHHVSFYTENRVISLLAATHAGMTKYLHILVEDIMQSVERITGLHAAIGVSRENDRLSDSHEIYAEAMNALHYCGKTKSSVHFISDIERQDKIDHEEMQRVVDRVEQLVRNGTQEELEAYLQAMGKKMAEQKLSSMTVRLMAAGIVTAVLQVAYTVADKKAFEELQSTSPLQQQVFLEEIRELWENCISFCCRAKQIVSEQRSKSGSVICDQALELIRRRYDDPGLSVVSVSSEIAVTPNYLSSLIKKNTGKTFVELLTEKRIEAAREMLLGTPMKIGEIAEKCGYNDQHYFSYCFKKETGISPNGCRRREAEHAKN